MSENQNEVLVDELISVVPVENITEGVVIGEDNDIDTEFVPEDVELTDEEKKKLLIKQLKAAKLKFKSVVHNGKETINKFGATYKKKRAQKNKLAKKSRKTNRK